MWEAYGARCAWCGQNSKDDGVKLVMDHKIPLELGGTNELDNLQLLCTHHNHIKQARFAEYGEFADALCASIALPEPHLRIGELLKAMQGKEVPIDLVNLVAREENRGDPTRRMRELRALGWVIGTHRCKRPGAPSPTTCCGTPSPGPAAARALPSTGWRPTASSASAGSRREHLQAPAADRAPW